MARTDNDTWDLASSVGATATMVAAARAMATTADNPLINDPFAEPLVRAVGVDFFTRLATGELDPTTSTATSEPVGMQRMADNMAVRTKFFDDFFIDATAAGHPASGDPGVGPGLAGLPAARGPPGPSVYEIDQPEVIEFKTRTLAELGAEPTANRRTVAIDLRYDWPPALTKAGFDPNQPTAWSAEGLLGYLPPDAQDRLLDTITALSAPGSRLATESVPTIDQERRRRRRSSGCRPPPSGGATTASTSTSPNWSTSATATRPPPIWATTAGRSAGNSVKELFAAHGLPPFDDDGEDVGNFGELQYVSGTLTRSRRAMTRTDADSWDVASSVGATATMVAAARALASEEPERAHRRPLRRAAGAGGRHRLLQPAASTARSALADDDERRRRRG